MNTITLLTPSLPWHVVALAVQKNVVAVARGDLAAPAHAGHVVDAVEGGTVDAVRRVAVRGFAGVRGAAAARLEVGLGVDALVAALREGAALPPCGTILPHSLPVAFPVTREARHARLRGRVDAARCPAFDVPVCANETTEAVGGLEVGRRVRALCHVRVGYQAVVVVGDRLRARRCRAPPAGPARPVAVRSCPCAVHVRRDRVGRQRGDNTVYIVLPHPAVRQTPAPVIRLRFAGVEDGLWLVSGIFSEPTISALLYSCELE